MAPTLSDSDWSLRTHPISFSRLMHLQPVGHDTFFSTSSGYPPAGPSRTYGGHVYAQAVFAASKTVARGQHVHNVTGHFLLQGGTAIPFKYVVKRVRDGGVYCLRMVEAYQNSKAAEGGKTPCFTATVSFKRDEAHKRKVRKDFEHQDAPRDHINRTYGAVLRGKAFEDHAVCPAGDAIWSDAMGVQQWKQSGDCFPGLEMRKVDMRQYNPVAVEGGGDGEAATKWRSLIFYRYLREQDVRSEQRTPAGEEVDDEEDLNLQACAHLYASDRNSLFLVQRALGFEKVLAQVGSLAHTVIFHGPIARTKMVDERGMGKLFVQESWTSGSGGDRVVHNSRLWDYEEGRVIATTIQDGMMRIDRGAKERVYDGENLGGGKESRL